MGLLDILSQYQQQPNRPPPHVFDDFDRVAREAQPEDIELGLEEAFNSEDTPPAEEMIGQLYEKSDDDTRASLLNQILGFGNRRVSPQEAHQISPREVQIAAAQAAQKNPSVIQAASRFYARHPALVQNLGQVALAVLMRGMARRRRM